MNIKITYNWLLDFLETDASPFEIQKYLSLAGPSIERVEKIGDDYVFDVEIISNRIDTASVFGIAQEAAAILPFFGKKAKIKFNPFKEYKLTQILKHELSPKYELKIKIKDKNLCSRFTAIILDNVKIAPSPSFIQNRLRAAGIKVINNVVDISNYLMLTLGQPTHIFDFDQIANVDKKSATMIMRQSKKGEKMVTLDGNEVELPGGDIVIEDGKGRLIDLCGIMGGLNSCVSKNSKRIILFVQTYNKQKIRKTAMTTGVRTVAATYFEKGLDEERVETTLVLGIKLLEQYALAETSSQIYDIYPHPYQKKSIKTNFNFFEKIMGVKISPSQITQILNSLGFETKQEKNKLEVFVPHFRKYDVSIPQDLVEEVARIYGYNDLPNRLSPPALVLQPEEFEKTFKIISKIKHFLKHLGLTEVINYSMISKKMIEEWGLKVENHLKIKNSISNEIEYLRTSLLPSLYKNIKDNEGKRETLKFFEIAKVYLPQDNDLPKEEYRLGIAINTDYFDLKGIIKSLLVNELNISSISLKKDKNDFYSKFYENNLWFSIFSDNKFLGVFGQTKNASNIFFAEFDLSSIIDCYKLLPKYQPINSYAIIKLDKTFEIGPNFTFDDIQKKASRSQYLYKLEVISLFKNKLTLRFYYSANDRNLTEEEAKRELEKV